jgi:sodium-dependent dicarboxylate transporter 2/3/5
MTSFPRRWIQNPRLRLLAGAALALLLTRLPALQGLPPEARATAGTALFTAWCWLTAALPLPVASLLPALLLPATGALPAREVAPYYFQDIIVLFLGGFVLALALERHELHRRFALTALRLFGARPRRVVLGFMLVAGLLSMFISNTSTALLMLPVAVALLEACRPEDARRLSPPLLLGIAYACSIGGTATPIGTAPNSVLLGQLADRFPGAPEIAFGTWFLGAAPFAITFLALAWLVLTRVVSRLPDVAVPELVEMEERAGQLPPRTAVQTRTLGVFVLVAALWMTRQGADFGAFAVPGWRELLPLGVSDSISDATVALFGVVLLFALPGEEGRGLLEWEDCAALPWGVLLLLGGGFALAKSCDATGLSSAIGESLSGTVGTMPPVLTVLVLSLGVTFLTEITSNTATINLLLPLAFSACVAAGVNPMLLAVPATFAVSCAFMLPVATPPNAILFGSGRISVAQMARAGFLLNLLTTLVVTLFTFLWIAPRWGIDLTVFPEWAR